MIKKEFLIFPILLLLIAACGKTPEENEEIAIISCNILEAFSDTDASQRIKEINRAREELNEEPFLGKDDEITQAINYNLCKELVLNDELYEDSLLKAIEQEKIAEEEAIEASKIAREKRKEEERQKIKEWAEKNKKTLAKLTAPKFVKFANHMNECLDYIPSINRDPLIVCYEINDFGGFEVTWEVKFKNGYTHVSQMNTIIIPILTVYDFHLDDKTLIDLENSNSLKEHVDGVNMYVTGINSKYFKETNLLPSEIRALTNIPLDVLKYNYDETLGIKYQIYPPISD